MIDQLRISTGRVQLLGSLVEFANGFEAPCKFQAPSGAIFECVCRLPKFVIDPATVMQTVELRNAGDNCLAASHILQANVVTNLPINPMWAIMCNRRSIRFTSASLDDPSIATLLTLPAALDALGLVCGAICADELIMCNGAWKLRSSELATDAEAPYGIFYPGVHELPQRFDAYERPLSELRRFRTLYAVLATVATEALGPESMSTKFDSVAMCMLSNAAPYVHESYRGYYSRMVRLYIDAWMYNQPLNYSEAGVDYPGGPRSTPRLLAASPSQPAWKPLPFWSLESVLE